MLLGATVGGGFAERYGVINLLTIQGGGYVVAGLLAGLLLRRSIAPLVASEPIG
jgi:hypothetical protein